MISALADARIPDTNPVMYTAECDRQWMWNGGNWNSPPSVSYGSSTAWICPAACKHTIVVRWSTTAYNCFSRSSATPAG